MKTGWHVDRQDGKTYYLDSNEVGAMAAGWLTINGRQYYFTQRSDSAGSGWYYDPSDKSRTAWKFAGGGRPLGSMYVNERTPDGELVGRDGAKLR